MLGFLGKGVCWQSRVGSLCSGKHWSVGLFLGGECSPQVIRKSHSPLYYGSNWLIPLWSLSHMSSGGKERHNISILLGLRLTFQCEGGVSVYLARLILFDRVQL